MSHFYGQNEKENLSRLANDCRIPKGKVDKNVMSQVVGACQAYMGEFDDISDNLTRAVGASLHEQCGIVKHAIKDDALIYAHASYCNSKIGSKTQICKEFKDFKDKEPRLFNSAFSMIKLDLFLTLQKVWDEGDKLFYDTFHITPPEKSVSTLLLHEKDKEAFQEYLDYAEQNRKDVLND